MVYVRKLLLTSSDRDNKTNDIFNIWARLPLTSATKYIINDNTSLGIIQMPNILRLNKLKERFNIILHVQEKWKF